MKNSLFCQLRSAPQTDRKSTRLNSSHDQISYAVFCLKKKNTQTHKHTHSKSTVHNSTHEPQPQEPSYSYPETGLTTHADYPKRNRTDIRHTTCDTRAI